MADDLMGLEGVPQPFRDAVRGYAELLREINGANAESLTLFGAIAAGSFDANRHLIRSVLVLGEVDLSALRRIAEHGARLGKHRIVAPLIMTPAYIKASLDTFPLELIEIHQMHRTLFGEDHFKDLSFEEKDVRHQCERELKAALIGLRQGLLAAAGREKVISGLGQEAAENLMRTLRGMLWLKGKSEAKPAAAVLTEIESLTDRKLPGIRTALDSQAEHGWAQLESLYADVAALGEIVDGW